MKATDARQYSPAQLEVLRQRAFALIKEGYTHFEIAKVLGIHVVTLYKWKRRAKQLSESDAVQGGSRGRPVGSCRSLTAEQEALIKNYVIDKSPKQLKFDFALWTRRAVMALIRRELGINLSIRAVGNYLTRWGMTSQRPTHRAIEQNPEQIKSWVESQYPEIAKRAKAEGAIIYWSDETAIKHDCNWVTGYSPCGKTPIIECHDGRWTTATMVSAISNQGLLRFKIQDKAMNQDLFIEFLTELISDEKRKIFLIVDNLQVHHGKKVREWVQAHKNQIELFYLPPYAPELNPDEYVNRALKTDIRSRAPAKIKALKTRAQKFMSKMARKAHWITKIFTYESVAYAAA